MDENGGSFEFGERVKKNDGWSFRATNLNRTYRIRAILVGAILSGNKPK